MSALTDHYALLLAINRYPGLSDLNGPENDAEEFRRWLIDDDGGNVDERNVKLVKSSDFTAATSPDDANPTETQFKKILNGWLRDETSAWRGRVGKRLYLFFAGHGFTAESLVNPALFTAQAQIGDPAHIAVLRYASKIRNAGFFDEVVLFIDCCQDVLKASAIAEPTWSPPDRSANVPMLQAFGAPRGAKAFETDAPAHGYFSSVLMEALRTAAEDSEGHVTARAVEDRFVELWDARYAKLTGYTPPFDAPRGMRLYRRSRLAQIAAVRGPRGPAPEALVLSTPRALGGVRGRPPAPPPPPAPVRGTIASRERGSRVLLLGANRRRVAEGTAPLEAELTPGRYIARFSLGDAFSETPFTVDADTPFRVEGGVLEFSSAAPLEGTSTNHEYQFYPAMQLTHRAADVAKDAPGNGTLLLFARDSTHLYGTAWRMPDPVRGAVRLQRLDPDGARVHVPLELTVDPDRGRVSAVAALALSTYLLGVARAQGDQWFWQEIALTIASDEWRTEVYVDTAADDWSVARFDLDTATVLTMPAAESDTLVLPLARAAAAARFALTERRRVLDAHAVLTDELYTPMTALLTAYALTSVPGADTDAIAAIVDRLETTWTEHSADVKLLKAWTSARTAAGTFAAPTQRLDFASNEVPMLGRGWSLAAELGHAAHLAREVQASVGVWRTGSAVWTQTLIPATATIALPARAATSLDTLLRGLDERAIMSIKAAAAVSPLQQTLRRMAVDAAESDELAELPAAIRTVAAAAALDEEIIADAVGGLVASIPARQDRDGGAAMAVLNAAHAHYLENKE